MIITIDTQKDSHEDIRKAALLLQGILNKSGIDSYDSYTNASSSVSAPADPTNMMSMFGDAPSSNAAQTASDTGPNFGSFLNLVEQKKKEDLNGSPKIEFY